MKKLFFLLATLAICVVLFKSKLISYFVKNRYDIPIKMSLKIGCKPSQEDIDKMWEIALIEKNKLFLNLLFEIKEEISIHDYSFLSVRTSPNKYSDELLFLFSNYLINTDSEYVFIDDMWYQDLLMRIDDTNENLINAVLQFELYPPNERLLLSNELGLLIAQKPILLEYMFKLGMITPETQQAFLTYVKYGEVFFQDEKEKNWCLEKIDILAKLYTTKQKSSNR